MNVYRIIGITKSHVVVSFLPANSKEEVEKILVKDSEKMYGLSSEQVTQRIRDKEIQILLV